MLGPILETLVKTGVVLGALMGAAAYLVLVERWIAAWIQDRRGPNRVGIPLTKIRIFGLGQPIADGLKLLLKSDCTPAQVDRPLYYLAPATMFAAALLAFAVVPFGSVLPPALFPASWGLAEPLPLVAVPGLDVGILFIFAAGGIAVYGVVLGGWASNNKYSLLGGLRSAAQLISYEVPLGLAILGVALATGSLRLDVIIAEQARSGTWNVMLQPLGFVVFVVASFAEAARVPFDLPESEQELVGGYHTEYAGIKLMMYLVSEFLHMMLAAVLIVVLFLGGWHLWGLTDGRDGPAGELVTWPVALLRVVVLLGKVLAVILFFMVARWSWPRFRFDQLMNLGWKVMVPWGLVNLVVVAACVEYAGPVAERLGVPPALVIAGVGWAVVCVAWLVTTVADPTTGSNAPRHPSAAARAKMETH